MKDFITINKKANINFIWKIVKFVVVNLDQFLIFHCLSFKIRYKTL